MHLKWAQELMWIRRNEQGVVIGISEELPKSEDFVPTAPRLVKRDPSQYRKGGKRNVQ